MGGPPDLRPMNLRSRQSTRGARFMVGLMSGTSADGIDAVVAELSGGGRRLRARVRAQVHQPFRPAAAHSQPASRERWRNSQLNFLLRQFAHAALRDGSARNSAGGHRGHRLAWATVHHLPNYGRLRPCRLARRAVIAQRTGIATIADFGCVIWRRARRAAGSVCGLGAVHRRASAPRIVQNLGGIGNLTFLPPRVTLGDVMAFDTGRAIW